MQIKDKITIFNAKNTKNKIPYSPYDDRTFTFETFENNSNQSFFNVLVSHFTLNIPLHKIQKPIRARRAVSELKMFINEKITYIILNIDIKSEYNKNKVIEYFKDYKVILGESRGYDGIDKFNLKGVLYIEPMTIYEGRVVLSQIQSDLEEFAIFSDEPLKRASLNAPILKNKVFLNNENGIRVKKIKKKLSEFTKDYDGDISNVKGNNLQELCLNTFKSLGYKPFKENNNGSINFSLVDDEGFFWYPNSPYTMHHANKLKSINIFQVIKDSDEGKRLLRLSIDFDSLENYNKGIDFKFNEEFIQTDDKVKIVDKFLNNRNGLLSIKSPMGTGKSKLINYIINESHEEDRKVLIITNRISVAEDFARKYKNVKLYNKDNYSIGDSLIVQYDSLWKYNISFFDLVIMDEFTSLLLHSRDNLSNNNINLLKFFGCFNKKLIIADAFLTGYEHYIMNKSENIVNIINEYRDETKLTSFTNKHRWIKALIDHSVDASKYSRKVTVSCTSTSMLEALRVKLEESGLRVVTLTSDTPRATKDIIYELFDLNDHDKWDVIIYSPTLTVGVSNMNNNEDHFHYDTGNSADVISSIQMIKRSRRARNIHYYVADKINYVCTDYNVLRDTYLSANRINNNADYLFDTDEYGEMRLSIIGSIALKIDVFKNMLLFNHKKSFEWLLTFHFQDLPRVFTEENSSNIDSIIKQNNKDKNLIEQKKIQDYFSLSEIEQPDFDNSEKVLGIVKQIESCVDIPADNYKEIMKDLIIFNLKYKDFFTQARYFKILMSNMSKEEIQTHLSNAIFKNNKKDFNFFSIISKNSYTLKTYHTKKELDSDFTYILKASGYFIKDNKYIINEDIQKYYMYMKI